MLNLMVHFRFIRMVKFGLWQLEQTGNVRHLGSAQQIAQALGKVSLRHAARIDAGIN